MQKVQYKNKAVELRMLGNTYAKILVQVPVSKATLSAWLSNVTLPEKVLQDLSRARGNRIRDIRAREVTVRKASAVVRRGFAQREAKHDYLWHAKKPMFEIGLGLILAGGAVGKASFGYMTTDYRQAKLIVAWAERFLDLPKGKIGIRLYLPRSFDLGTARLAWSREVGLPAAAFKKPIITPEPKRRPKNAAGVARIEVGGPGTALRIRTWLDMLVVRYAE